MRSSGRDAPAIISAGRRAGTIIFEGLPPRAVVYANDTLVEVRGPLALPIGTHRIRVETATGC